MWFLRTNIREISLCIFPNIQAIFIVSSWILSLHISLLYILSTSVLCKVLSNVGHFIANHAQVFGALISTFPFDLHCARHLQSFIRTCIYIQTYVHIYTFDKHNFSLKSCKAQSWPCLICAFPFALVPSSLFGCFSALGVMHLFFSARHFLRVFLWLS